MKTNIAVLLVSLCLLLCAVGLMGYVLYKVYTGPSPLVAEHIVSIPKGASLKSIADILKREQAVRSALAFRAVVMLRGEQAKLKAGEYLFAPHMSLADVVAKVVAGDVYVRQVTIPEGWTSYRIFELLKSHAELTGDITALPPEGGLLPQTYRYQTGDTKQKILDEMQANMSRTLAALWPVRAADLPVQTLPEALVLASIVEKETGLKGEERARVAGVFVNRLRKGMKLETDPTVIYALTKGREKNDGQGPLGRRLLKKDMEIDSPYNTYKYAGLPPTPICNPGEAAIKATLNPENHNYLYFVADGTGGHVFAETYEEHLKNVAKWRTIRAQQ